MSQGSFNDLSEAISNCKINYVKYEARLSFIVRKEVSTWEVSMSSEKPFIIANLKRYELEQAGIQL